MQKQQNIGLITRKIKIFLETSLPGSINDQNPQKLKIIDNTFLSCRKMAATAKYNRFHAFHVFRLEGGVGRKRRLRGIRGKRGI